MFSITKVIRLALTEVFEAFKGQGMTREGASRLVTETTQGITSDVAGMFT